MIGAWKEIPRWLATDYIVFANCVAIIAYLLSLFTIKAQVDIELETEDWVLIKLTISYYWCELSDTFSLVPFSGMHYSERWEMPIVLTWKQNSHISVQKNSHIFSRCTDLLLHTPDTKFFVRNLLLYVYTYCLLWGTKCVCVFVSVCVLCNWGNQTKAH